MMQINFKKIFLIAVISSLSISALIWIIIFLIWEFREMEVKILFTALSLWFYSLLWFCCSLPYEKNRFKFFGILWIIICIISCIYSILFIWDYYTDYNNTWKIILSAIWISFSLGHISLLTLINSEKGLINTILKITIFFVLIVLFLLLILIWWDIDDSDVFIRLIWVSVILDVLGTIILPILNKVLK